MANPQAPSARFGCLGMVVGAVVLAAIVVLVVFAGLFVLAIAAGLLVVGLVAIGVDRLLLALSPKRRERRANQTRAFIWRYGAIGLSDAIDTTAVETAEDPNDDDTDRLGPGGRPTAP